MIKHRKIFYIISGILVAISLAAFIIWGLNLAIDFTGGSLLEVEYLPAGEASEQVRPSVEIVKEAVGGLGLGNISVQPFGEKGLLLRTRDLTEEEHQVLLQSLGDATQKRFDSIGPIIGQELARKAWTAIFLVILMIVIFIAWAFRKAGRPVASWKYGVIAVVALVHDVTIPTGVFAALGHFYHVEVDILFVTALLTILGFSVHDTIVVFDRIRENLKKGIGNSFEDGIERSLGQVIGRSIKTSLAILLVLASLFFFGGEATRYFSLTLILGIIFGTYSSLFLASPLLVTWYNWQQKNGKV